MYLLNPNKTLTQNNNAGDNTIVACYGNRRMRPNKKIQLFGRKQNAESAMEARFSRDAIWAHA